MSKQANPVLIGAFVIVALILLIAAILLLGGGAFKTKPEYVMYFQGSVKGLRIGAPVDFRGVTIGKVTDIRVEADYKNNEYTIPVIAEFDRSGISGKSSDRPGSEINLDELIEQGLRAQLNIQSLLTGQLFVQLDMYPEDKVSLRGDGSLPEIPTIPTPLEKLEKSLSNFDLEAALDNITSSMRGIQALTNSPELLSAIANLDKALISFNKLAGNIDSKITPLMASINHTLTEAQNTLRQLGTAAGQADHVLNEDSELMYRIQGTLNDLSRAAKSVQTLADTLERNPESILKGKQVQD
jgi:paraquat-inducible protein B